MSERVPVVSQRACKSRVLPTVGAGHCVSRPRGTGSVGDSVGEGSEYAETEAAEEGLYRAGRRRRRRRKVYSKQTQWTRRRGGGRKVYSKQTPEEEEAGVREKETGGCSFCLGFVCRVQREYIYI